MREPLGFLSLYSLLTPEEKEACETGLWRGYMTISEPTTGLHLLYYGARCALDRRPCVVLMPTQGARRRLLVWVPQIKALPRVTLLAVDAGVAISRVCPLWMRLVGSIDQQRAEPVTSLIAQEAGYWCGIY